MLRSAPDNALTPYDDFVQTTPESRVDDNFDMISHSYSPTLRGQNHYNDMVIESQNIDTNALGLDPLLWLDYVPQDTLGCFDLQNDASIERMHLDRAYSGS